MIEVVATTIITVSSALLLGYWFRYTCLLILSARTTQDYAGTVVEANHLTFASVQARLQNQDANLEELHRLLDRDYSLLNLLFRSGNEGELGLEDRILQFDYRLMSVWYSVSSSFSPSAARKALEEMSMVVAHFANAVGERSACASAA